MKKIEINIIKTQLVDDFSKFLSTLSFENSNFKCLNEDDKLYFIFEESYKFYFDEILFKKNVRIKFECEFFPKFLYDKDDKNEKIAFRIKRTLLSDDAFFEIEENEQTYMLSKKIYYFLNSLVQDFLKKLKRSSKDLSNLSEFGEYAYEIQKQKNNN